MMLKISFNAETGNDARTPISIANAVINVYMEPTQLSALQTSKDIEDNLVCLEEIADHILIYVNAHRRIMK